MAKKKINYSFLKGCGKVPKEDYPAAQEELKQFLGCSSLQYYYRKRKEFLNMPIHVKEGIENILGKYGVAPEDIWDITEITA